MPSVAILGLAGVVALLLTLGRDFVDDNAPQCRGAARLAFLVVLLQAGHFAEELATGFPERFPALFGLPPMPRGFFELFNLAWLAIWTASALGLAARRRAALFALWFLGIACVANGVAHPSLAALVGGYFPGLVTAPLVGVLGILLLRRLLHLTRSAGASPGPA